MRMQAKYQIFVSSTYEDLRQERDAVIRAILEMGHIPVGMEMFSAADEEQWTIIQRHINESDYYVVVIGHRYGSITPDGISYTQKEYQHALAEGIPILAFLIADDAPWNPDYVDRDEPSVTLLGEFKTLARSKPISEWTDRKDLYGKAAVALMKAFNTQPRPGWVRAGEAVGAQVAAELSRLSTENDKLRTQLAATETKTRAEEEKEIVNALRKLSDQTTTLSYRTVVRGPWLEKEATYLALFIQVAPIMVNEAAVRRISEYWSMLLSDDESWYATAANQLQEVLFDFMTLGLAEPSQKKHSVKDNAEYWSLTEFGVDVLKRLTSARLDRQASENDTVEEEPNVREAPSLDKSKSTKSPTRKKSTAKSASPKKTAKKAAARNKSSSEKAGGDGNQ